MINPNTNALPAAITAGTTNNVPAHIEELKDAINNGSLLRRLSQAQIDALSGVTRPIGLVVVNLTRGCQQMWTGAEWVDVTVGAALLKVGSVTTSPGVSAPVSLGASPTGRWSVQLTTFAGPARLMSIDASSFTCKSLEGGVVVYLAIAY